MGDAVIVRRLDALDAAALDDLADILVAVVAAGASVGFLPPLGLEAARAYWEGVCRPGVVLLVAERGGRIVGTGQLDLAMRPNGRRRAEVCKVLVHPEQQGRGIGRAVMQALEVEARADGRRLLHLDTDADAPSNRLYRAMGYQEVGTIPAWAIGADGELHGTTFYYKALD